MVLLAGSAKTVLAYDDAERINHTSTPGQSAGDVVQLGGDLRGFVDDDIAALGTGQVMLAKSLMWARAASGTTCSIGDEIWYDASAGLAIPVALGIDASADYPLGLAAEAKVATQTGILIKPFTIHDRYSVIRPTVVQHDCEAGTLNEEKVLIPAWMNRHGLVFVGAFGLIIEDFAGGDEDQGIITIEDEDDNAICTLTVADASGDDVGDIIQSNISLYGSASGVAWKTVAAGKAVQSTLTQKTAGVAAAGKINIYVQFLPLL